MEPVEVFSLIIVVALGIACLAIPLCIVMLAFYFVLWLVERRRPTGGAHELRGMSTALNALLGFLLVFLLYYGVTTVPYIGNRTWCRSQSPDGTYSLRADMLASATIMSGTPTRFTLERVGPGGDVLWSRRFVVYVPYDGGSCAVEWGDGYVDVGADNPRYEKQKDCFFSYYWGDEE